jgi:hypothetical protein
VCSQARVLLQRRALVKRCEAMQCLAALQDAACDSCRDLVARSSAAAVEPALLAKALTQTEAPGRAHQMRQAYQSLRQQQACQIDQRIKVGHRNLCCVGPVSM